MDVRNASKADRHLASSAPPRVWGIRLRERPRLYEEADLEHAVMAHKANGIADFIEAAAWVGEGQRHDPHSAGLGIVLKDESSIRSRRRSALRRFRRNMPLVASSRLRPVMASPPKRAGIPVKT